MKIVITSRTGQEMSHFVSLSFPSSPYKFVVGYIYNIKFGYCMKMYEKQRVTCVVSDKMSYIYYLSLLSMF